MSEPYTMLPNWLIDAMPDLSEAALKVCLVVARKTIGWHKNSRRGAGPHAELRYGRYEVRNGR